jgi:hypothetical protein
VAWHSVDKIQSWMRPSWISTPPIHSSPRPTDSDRLAFSGGIRDAMEILAEIGAGTAPSNPLSV